MALVRWNIPSPAFKGLSSPSQKKKIQLVGHPSPYLILPRHSVSRSVLAYSRRRKTNSPVQSSKKNKVNLFQPFVSRENRGKTIV